MRDAHQVATALQGNLGAMAAATGKAPRSITLDPQAVSVVNTLFDELRAIFPAWRQAWPTQADEDNAKRTWVKGFAAAGIRSVEQIRHGIMRCRQSGEDFVPSLGRFVEWCQPTPEALGLPSPDKAYREAIRNVHPAMAGVARWSHDAVYHAACESGYLNLNKLPLDASRKLFDRNYAIAVRLLVAGEKLKAMPLALPEQVDGRMTPEVGQAALAELRAKLRGDA
ncbi:replication protein P [Pseudomonas sp. RIT-PI-AD]|uniref:replication protein P n=1 Tax=Pseudomonas sp. RIT-PI-AD TaxID=3035294 RepID=UPI0021DAA5FD|nr:replication protein P [Pseudomonas sp. RIT-PI-AD]